MNTQANTAYNNTDISLYEFLLSIPAFCMLGDDELEMLERIMRVDEYSNGHSFKSANNIYLVMEGEVSVTHRDTSGNLQHDHVQRGDFFGLYSLIDNSKKSAACTAAGTVRAASLPRTAFELLFRASLPLSLHFQNIVANQIARCAAESYISARRNTYIN